MQKELSMGNQTTQLREETAAVERSTQGAPYDTVSNDGAVSPMVLHAGSQKKRKRAIATRRQTAANPANAARSTGPRTVEGKKISARSAIRHGLTSRNVLLIGEDPKEYERFGDRVTICCAPQGQLEQELVEMMKEAMWARRRIARMEAGVLQHLTSDEVNPAVSAAVLAPTLQLLDRYAVGKERTIFRALQALQRNQDRRREELGYSPQEQMLLAQDRYRTLKDLAEKRTGEAAGKPIGMANPTADQAASPGSQRSLAVVPDPDAAFLRNEANSAKTK
jgi:hypothetical protein